MICLLFTKKHKMKQNFIDKLLEYYETSNDLDETIKHFLDLGFSKKKITTTISDLRRTRGIRLKYKKHYDTNVFKSEPNYHILILDIETSPSKAYVWSRWNNDIHGDQMIQEWFMLSWSAKFLNSDVTYSDVVTPDEVLGEDDYRITKRLHDVMEKSIVILAHNGKNFDFKKINTRFLYHNLAPLNFKVIDTLQIARSVLGNSSNRLDDLVKYYGLGEKTTTTFQLWKDCLDGNEDSLETMRKYNVNDVVILEKLYLKLRPFIKNHPNVGNFFDKENVCPTCGSHRVERYGFYYTNLSKFPRFKCKDCGSLSRSRANQNSKEKMKNLLISI
jgi:DNA polymerase elongation subunit (family B)